jgi:beta-lactamase class C
MNRIYCFIKYSIFILNLSVLFSLNAFAENNTEFVRKTINNFMLENNIPGIAVELYIDGKPSSYYYGYANKKTKTPINEKTIFEIGSISKIMTGLLLAQQVDGAKVQINDSVKKYLSELSDTFNEISLLNLATHTSALPFEPAHEIDKRIDLENYLNTWNPQYDSDEKWVYSNISFGLLGLTLERINHASARQLFYPKILKPLHMQPIVFIVPKRLKQAAALGYDHNTQPVATDQLDLFSAAWAFKASAKDMQHFLHAAIGLPGTPDSILYPMRMTQSAYFKLDHFKQGLGWQIYSLEDEADHLLEPNSSLLIPINIESIYEKPLFDNQALIEKNGHTNGFSSYIGVIPNRKTGIVILANHALEDAQIIKLGREILFKVNDLLEEDA